MQSQINMGVIAVTVPGPRMKLDPVTLLPLGGQCQSDPDGITKP